ncbi:hypothetical protein FEM03_17610 [Phragmitibacter flavus]|uniref:Uncharacterized protein n=2 Tax=Phragmitibacter flavus TaxID=2576071 RepID=A0A5R8KCZ0_9BACT|nr:hypothetical protein FEM03_17610 [Phragmitibacter flavus]
MEVARGECGGGNACEESNRKRVLAARVFLTGSESGGWWAVEVGGDSDKEANESLKVWGRLTEAEFLPVYRGLDADLLKRAGAMLGLKIGKPAPANMKSLHKAAHRFAVNTAS